MTKRQIFNLRKNDIREKKIQRNNPERNIYIDKPFSQDPCQLATAIVIEKEEAVKIFRGKRVKLVMGYGKY